MMAQKGAFSVFARLRYVYQPTRGIGRPSVFTPRLNFWLRSCQFRTVASNMQEHYLDKQDVESFTIPGAKVFDRYFDLPLGTRSQLLLELQATKCFGNVAILFQFMAMLLRRRESKSFAG